MRRHPMMTSILTTTTLSSAASVRLPFTPAERLRGRYMRAPDGHDGGAGGDAGGSAGAGGEGGTAPGSAADGAGGAGGADQSGGGGADPAAGAEGGADKGDGAAGDKPGTILGEAAAGDGAGDGADAAKSGEGEGADGAKEGKEGDGSPAVEVLGAPEKYELTLSEDLTAAGMTFDKEAFEAVEPVLRELNLSNDAAQALVGAYAGKVLPLLEKRAGERWDTTGADMRRGWETEAKADPDIGGAKFDETKALARQTFTRFGVKADGPFLKLLEESGLGSHPDMLRFVANVGRLTGEATADNGSGGQQQPRLADRVYGSPTPRE